MSSLTADVHIALKNHHLHINSHENDCHHYPFPVVLNFVFPCRDDQMLNINAVHYIHKSKTSKVFMAFMFLTATLEGG